MITSHLQTAHFYIAFTPLQKWLTPHIFGNPDTLIVNLNKVQVTIFPETLLKSVYVDICISLWYLHKYSYLAAIQCSFKLVINKYFTEGFFFLSRMKKQIVNFSSRDQISKLSTSDLFFG